MRTPFYRYYSDPFYRNSISMMLNAITGALFGLVFWAIAARTMSPESVGLATVAVSSGTLIVTIALLGMDASLMRFLPGSKNKEKLYNTLVNTSLLLSAILSVLFILIIYHVSPAMATLLHGRMLLLFFIYVGLMSICFLQNVAFVTIRRGELSFIQNLFLGLRILPLAFIAYMNVEAVFLSLDVAYIVAIACGAYMLYTHGIVTRPSLDTLLLKNTLIFSLGNYLSSIFSLVPLTLMPIIVINTVGAEGCAYYYMAYSIAAMLFTIPSAVSAALLVEGSHETPLRDSLIKSVLLIGVLMIPLIVAVFLFGDKILLLFSKEYSQQSFELLKLFATASLLSSITSLYMAVMRVKKNLSSINLVVVLLAVLLVSGSYVGLITSGLIGIGYAWVFAYLVMCPVTGILSWKHIRTTVNGKAVG